MPKLDRLNTLVELEMNVPVYRKTVDRSGHNLTWLRKASKKLNLSDELVSLLALDISELTKV